MEVRDFDTMLMQVLQQDFSAGTEEFRDALLARCLTELDDGCRIVELDDEDLGMLAAAGNSASLEAPHSADTRR